MDPKEVANPSQDVILPPLVQNSSTDICSPDANPEAADSATKEVKDGRREGKTFPKESIMNVTVDKSNTESIDIMTRFIDMCLSNGGYDLCLGYTNRTKFMQRIVNEEFKYDGIFNEYKQPSYGKFTKGIYNALKQLEELVSHSHASADAERGKQYPASIRDLVTKYMTFVQSRKLSAGVVSQAVKNNSMVQSNAISVTQANEPTDVQATSRSRVLETNDTLVHRLENARDRPGIAYDDEVQHATKRSKKAQTETSESERVCQMLYENSLGHLELQKNRFQLQMKQVEFKMARMSQFFEAKKMKRELKFKKDELSMQQKERNMELKLRAINEKINFYKDEREVTEDQTEKEMYSSRIVRLSEKKLEMVFKIE